MPPPQAALLGRGHALGSAQVLQLLPGLGTARQGVQDHLSEQLLTLGRQRPIRAAVPEIGDGPVMAAVQVRVQIQGLVLLRENVQSTPEGPVFHQSGLGQSWGEIRGTDGQTVEGLGQELGLDPAEPGGHVDHFSRAGQILGRQLSGLDFVNGHWGVPPEQNCLHDTREGNFCQCGRGAAPCKGEGDMV